MAAINTYPPQPSSSTQLFPAALGSSAFNDIYPYSPVTLNPTAARGHGVIRSSSPTSAEKEELKVFDGTIRKMFRKENWKNRDFVRKYALLNAPNSDLTARFQSP